MLIDWFTVVAQAINFLILVGLLKRFLYRPILDAIDAREKHIAQTLADAQAQQDEAQRQRQTLQRQNDDIARERGALLAQAAQDARARRDEWMHAAQQECEAWRQSQAKSLQTQRQQVLEALAQRAQGEVLDIARRALSDLADDSLEDRMVAAFVRRWRAQGPQAAAAMGAGAGASAAPAECVVRCAFTLNPAQQARIRSAVAETWPQATPSFETRPDLIAGIELATEGHAVSWSIQDYLARVARAYDETLRAIEPPPSAGEATASPGGAS